MAQIVWRDNAGKDLERVQWFMYAVSLQTAIHMAKVIIASTETLARMPEIGRPMGDGSGRREYHVPFGSGFYVLRYMINQDGDIVVLRVWHSREDRNPV